ncbi:MAG: alpha-2-macroglobulin family protein [Myxococcota bacterium]
MKRLFIPGVRVASLSLTLAALTLGHLSFAQPSTSRGTVVVPERFLRSWDPITVFFPKAVGPRNGGPEDAPERFVVVEPRHPGAFTWLDAKTLQFRPAEPWPALTRYSVQPRSGVKTSVVTLMSPPSRTLPADRADDLEPVDALTLTFPRPLPPAALAAMTRIELRPRPGLDAAHARWLDKEDFEVKSMERRSAGAPATYVLRLEEPIPESTRATVHFRLSLDDEHEGSFAQLSFSTLDAFRLTSFGCAAQRLPVTPEGSLYAAEQAIRCPSGRRPQVDLVFSSEPSALDPVTLANLVRLTPAVEGLSFERSGRVLSVRGGFEADKRYELSVHPTALTDVKGRPLDVRGVSRMSFSFPRQAKQLSWVRSRGTVERYGPQTVPLRGRGFDRVDLRIHRIDPLDRRFWPFSTSPVAVDESRRPPGPGEEPERGVPPHSRPTPESLRAHLSTLGSADVSRIVDLPLSATGGAASFGLDLGPHLDGAMGVDQPGTYLVGVRRLDGSTTRHWTRLQVTDLALSTVEEPHAVRFYVTSLRTGRPLARAEVRVEGVEKKAWVTFFSGRTDEAGAIAWRPRGPRPRGRLRRVVVTLGEDRLVLDPSRGPERYARSRWQEGGGDWLAWTLRNNAPRGEQEKSLCHIFSERPVYRPEETVHLKGYVRRRHEGVIRAPGASPLSLEIRGAGNLKVEHPIALSEAGSFYRSFAEKNLPTGIYSARVLTKKRQSLCEVSFRMEAYRVPKFELSLLGPSSTPIDRAFQVKAVGSYYAGGPVSGRPLRWRVTQFPYDWTPPNKRKGFFYSTGSRYSRNGPFRAMPNLGRSGETDDSGAAELDLNPALEATAQPRTYVVEATLTGADDQTVSATKQIRALPPFVLGLKVPRFIERAKSIDAEVIAQNPEGDLLGGREVTVRLVHRTWHSHLEASDFSDGVAKYVTDVVETPVSEETLTTQKRPVKLRLPLATGGVYVVELVARDRLGRAQVVAVDLFAGGDTAVSWKKPERKVFEASTDKSSYAPGDTAQLLLQSPVKEARALAVIEAPEGNIYRWVDVKGGVGQLRLPIAAAYVPRLPVHFVLMRGRSGAPPERSEAPDLGKPVTMAATTWLSVAPVEHELAVGLEHPERAQPGDTVKVKIRLADRAGRPRSGEVTLWLVDQAVLALGREARLDPLANFITPVESYASVTDTRNEVYGRLPFADNPGGDAPAKEASKRGAEGLLDKVTVRKNIQAVPVFRPRIAVPASGEVTVEVPLPDNLTNFAVRAKAVSGWDRFGFAKSRIEVRLPVLVQPVAPRFVRAGDRFKLGGLARVVEGPGGPGRVELALEGARVAAGAGRRVELDPQRPTSILFDAEVLTPAPLRGAPAPELRLTLAVARDADGAKDAFQTELPLRPDRARETRRILKTLAPGETLSVEALPEPARPGTSRRTIFVANDPGLVHMASGLDALRDYPHGSTEARVSRARALLATRSFRELLHQPVDEDGDRRGVEETLAWLEGADDGSGLFGYWPGSRGYVWLTADALELMVQARKAGFDVDPNRFDRTVSVLGRALRSDFGAFVDGAEWSERVASLRALAVAARFESAYGAELANKAQYLDTEAKARVAQAFLAASVRDLPVLERIQTQLLEDVVFRLHQGREIYGGLQARHGPRPSLILPSETRTLAEIVRALYRLNPAESKLELLTDALVTLGRGDGWGSTNANAAALAALTERMTGAPGSHGDAGRIDVRGKSARRVSVGGETPTGFVETEDLSALTLVSRGPNPVVVRVETSYVPASSGAGVEARSAGFVVSRRQLGVREGQPPRPQALDAPALEIRRSVGDVVEEHVQVVNPKPRTFVAVRVPLAAGLEPMNPALATAPREARPSGRDTLDPTYRAFLDDEVTYYFDVLPKGTFDFYFRTRAVTEGRFTQPPARAEMLYDPTVTGRSPGARVVVTRSPAEP